MYLNMYKLFRTLKHDHFPSSVIHVAYFNLDPQTKVFKNIQLNICISL